MPWCRRVAVAVAVCGLLASVLLLAGCGSTAPTTGTLIGTVPVCTEGATRLSLPIYLSQNGRTVETLRPLTFLSVANVQWAPDAGHVFVTEDLMHVEAGPVPGG
jgi:pectin methylesterase-like acyl-CoA thioesterase